MVFGIFIDVPLLTVPFLLMLKFRNRLSNAISRLRLPLIALYVLLAVPLLIFEEQIDCMPAWCGTVVIPPTIPFLLLEMLVLGGLVVMLHAKSPLRVTLVFSIYGVLFELFLGGLAGAPRSDSCNSSSICGNGLRVRIDAALVSPHERKGSGTDSGRICSAIDWNPIVCSVSL